MKFFAASLLWTMPEFYTIIARGDARSFRARHILPGSQRRHIMLRTQLLHPTILQALAGAGHGSTVLIADGNYPLSTKTNPQAARVYLNLRPGLVSVTEILATILTAIPVEAAHVMQTA